MTDLCFVEEIRRVEIAQAIREIGAHKALGSSIIEIGGGAGWQAMALQAAGYHVRSFDLPDSNLAEHRSFPIEDYDGHRIPVSDATFDIAFSSNVLEHIPHVEAFQAEILRILKPDGIAIHIVPSATWRIHTSLAHYPWLGKALVSVVRAKLGFGNSGDAQLVARAASRRAPLELLSRIFVPPRHGEKGNVVTEIWHFSRYRWTPLFEKTGWHIVRHDVNRLFYTGEGILNRRLSIKTRKRLSPWLGSSCHIYVLRPAGANPSGR